MIEREVIEFVAAADWTDDCRVRVELKKRITKLTPTEARALRTELDAAISEAEKAADELRHDHEPARFDLVGQVTAIATDIGATVTLEDRLSPDCRADNELLHVAEFTPHSRAELEGAAALDGDTDLELARQVWVLLTQGRSRTMKRTGWRFYVDPRGTNGSFSTYMRAYRSRLLPAAERLQNVSLESRPALEVIEKYGAHADNLLYVDPPYVHSTRRGARYTHEMTEADHREMAAALRECAAAVMLSGYASPLYDELFGDWHQVQIGARSDNAVDRDVVEVVWSNRPLGDFLWHGDVLS